jgi:RND family efflux transporter MFP subunit
VVAAAEETAQTSQVRQGSITLSVSGAGALAPGQERALGFSVSGTLAELNVQVGDVVAEGQALARLDNLADLQAEVIAAQEELVAAQEELRALQENAAAALASARLAVTGAQEALYDAQAGLIKEGMARCDQETIEAYYYEWTHARKYLESLGDGGGNADYYLTEIVPAKNTVARAYNTYAYCAGFADYEVEASEATLALAEAELAQAQARLDSLVENDGIDPLELAKAENKVANAQLAVYQANEKLAGATITAPFAGTVLAVDGQVGEEVGSGAVITLADLAHPRVEFSVDETDLDMLALGELAKVTFDAIPGRTFEGQVIRIDPALESSGGYSVVTGLIELDLSQESEPARLVKGLNASVELVQASAENVLLVPVQAVRDLGDGSYAVFVVEPGGQPRLRVVEVGLRDAASAEIKSGLALGDAVTTGVVDTK